MDKIGYSRIYGVPGPADLRWPFVDLEDIEKFAERAAVIKDRKGYEGFVAIYGEPVIHSGKRPTGFRMSTPVKNRYVRLV